MSSPGNTPTGVGKTKRTRSAGDPIQKHPHGRGEDQRPAPSGLPRLETPPRAWGRPRAKGSPESWARNTPTGVGKTAAHEFLQVDCQKHPHGRGEDVQKTGLAA